MSHSDATNATDRPANVGSQDFSQVRGALIRALRAAPEACEAICDAMELLEGMQQRFESARRVDQVATEHLSSPRKQAKRQEYEIQTTPQGQFLTERRPGHSQPFRCPRETFDAAAEVMAAAGDALHFDEMLDLLEARLGQHQPDYRLRVALRFWMTHRLVTRFRTKYRAIEPSSFLATSRQQWDELQRRVGADTRAA